MKANQSPMSRTHLLSILSVCPLVLSQISSGQDHSLPKIDVARAEFSELKERGVGLSSNGRDLRLKSIQLKQITTEPGDTAESILQRSGFSGSPENVLFLQSVNPGLADLENLPAQTGVVIPSIRRDGGALVQIDLNRSLDKSYLQTVQALDASGSAVSKNQHLEAITTAIEEYESNLEPETIQYVTSLLQALKAQEDSGGSSAALQRELDIVLVRASASLGSHYKLQTTKVTVKFAQPGLRVCYCPQLVPSEVDTFQGVTDNVKEKPLFTGGKFYFWAAPNDSGEPVRSHKELVSVSGRTQIIELVAQ